MNNHNEVLHIDKTFYTEIPQIVLCHSYGNPKLARVDNEILDYV